MYITYSSIQWWMITDTTAVRIFNGGSSRWAVGGTFSFQSDHYTSAEDRGGRELLLRVGVCFRLIQRLFLFRELIFGSLVSPQQSKHTLCCFCLPPFWLFGSSGGEGGSWSHMKSRGSFSVSVPLHIYLLSLYSTFFHFLWEWRLFFAVFFLQSLFKLRGKSKMRQRTAWRPS